jgi:integrase
LLKEALANKHLFYLFMAKAGIDAGVIRERTGAAGRSVSALSFHSLRHSFNSALANAGVSQELRQKLTGHASADMNAIYTHHELETVRTAIKTLPRLPKSAALIPSRSSTDSS